MKIEQAIAKSDCGMARRIGPRLSGTERGKIASFFVMRVKGELRRVRGEFEPVVCKRVTAADIASEAWKPVMREGRRK